MSKRINFTQTDTLNKQNRKKTNTYSQIPNWCPTSNQINKLEPSKKPKAYTRSHTITTELSSKNPSLYPPITHQLPSSTINIHSLYAFSMKLWRIKCREKSSPTSSLTTNKRNLRYWLSSLLDFRLLLTFPTSSGPTTHLLFPFHPTTTLALMTTPIFQMSYWTIASQK